MPTGGKSVLEQTGLVTPWGNHDEQSVPEREHPVEETHAGMVGRNGKNKSQKV